MAAVSAFNLKVENVGQEEDRIFDRMESVPVANVATCKQRLFIVFLRTFTIASWTYARKRNHLGK
tara:strand:- start:485769 stop:485963 length:195 start_codon:yes stop_codon:yes gene_type:complete